MYKSLEDMLKASAEAPMQKMVVASAADAEVLEGTKIARDRGLIEPILIGDENKIREISEQVGLEHENVEIHNITDPIKIAQKTMELVSSGEADFLMKGLIDTSTILRTFMDKEYGLRRDHLISHVSVMELELDRLVLMTDGGINIAPDLEKKIQIAKNAIEVAHKLGNKEPKLAALAAIESINPDMQATIDAAALAKMADRGQIEGAIIDGPLALDNAISEEAAKHKGIKSPVAGKADILLMPEIVAGNIFYKSMMFLGGKKAASVVVGGKVPVVLTSRADDAYTKVVSICLGELVAQ